MRSQVIAQRTALVNQARGLLAEYGIVMPQGRAAAMNRLPEILEDAENGLSERFRAELHELLEELRHLDARVVRAFRQGTGTTSIPISMPDRWL